MHKKPASSVKSSIQVADALQGELSQIAEKAGTRRAKIVVRTHFNIISFIHLPFTRSFICLLPFSITQDIIARYIFDTLLIQQRYAQRN